MCHPSATPFPAGSLFASQQPPCPYSPGDRGWVAQDPAAALAAPGQLMAFLKADASGHWREVRICFP